jgi:trypsin-like peptidase/tetratricopeptide repeat protein
MAEELTIDRLREQAVAALDALKGQCTSEELAQAKDLVETLRNLRDYETMGRLAEAVSRVDPKDPRNRRLYAQYLIDTGKATAAIDMLRPLAQRLPKAHPESGEATGLLGRAYKQIFFDAGDKTTTGAREALKQAIAAYRGPYEEDPERNTWHGVNLIALLTRARGIGLRVAMDLQPREIARQVVAALERTPPERRDEWFLPTLAEASLGLGDWGVVERNIREYAAAEDAQGFLIASTLRQFTQVWDLEHGADARGRALVDILRARLMALPGGELKLAPAELQRVAAKPEPDKGQLEAVLGNNGSMTFRWWKTGIERARSVAALWHGDANRVGTGFVVRAGDLGRSPPEELLILTNFHVVNEHGASPGIRPEEARVVLEAVDAARTHAVAELLWSSPPDLHDASLLRVQPALEGVAPLPLATSLPVLDDEARVYVIGHPGGRDLAFSFQDNEFLDHEGPPAGQPPIPGVCRVHYRAPTEGGSSGSPVFNARLWEVIALHHKGGKLGMPRLNGKDGSYAANEGISMRSIITALG